MNDRATLDLPRVLMLCHDTIQPFTGGGATLGGLFASFPAEKLFSIHHDGHAVDTSRLGSTYRVNNEDVQYFQPINLIRSVTQLSSRASVPVGQQTDAASGASLVAGVGSGLRTLITHAGYFRFSPAIVTAIHEFRPQLLYGWLGDPIWGRTLTRLARHLQVPYVVHFMDNHIGVKPDGGWINGLNARLFRSQVDRAVQGAAAVLAISDAMAAAYGARWQRPVRAFHGVMATQDWPAPTPRIADAVFEVAFTGSIESGQLSGLIDMARAVDKLCEDGVAVRLVLYVTDYYRERVAGHFNSFRNVVMRPHPVSERLRAALVQSDVLVLAYGFEQTTVDYYRYSFPTKLVPYMLSGTPILAYGPASIAPIGYALTGNWARSVTRNSVDHLAAALLELLLHPAERLRLGTLANEAARREHDQSVVSVDFAKTLRSAVLKARRQK